MRIFKGLCFHGALQRMDCGSQKAFVLFHWNKRNTTENPEMIFVHKNLRQSFAPCRTGGDSSAFSSGRLKVKSVTNQCTVYSGEASHPAWSVQAACKTGKRWKGEVGAQGASPASAAGLGDLGSHPTLRTLFPYLQSEGVESIPTKAFPAVTFCALSPNRGSKIRTQELRGGQPPSLPERWRGSWEPQQGLERSPRQQGWAQQFYSLPERQQLPPGEILKRRVTHACMGPGTKHELHKQAFPPTSPKHFTCFI